MCSIQDLPQSALLYRFDERVYPRRTSLFHTLGYMTIHIRRERHSRMTEGFGHGFDIIAVLQSKCCVSVAEIMKAYFLNVELLHDALETLIRLSMWLSKIVPPPEQPAG